MKKKIQKQKFKNIIYNLRQLIKTLKFQKQLGAPLMGVAVSSNAGEWATYYGHDPVHIEIEKVKKEFKKRDKKKKSDVLDTPAKVQARADELRVP